LSYACWPQGRTASGQHWPVLFGPGNLPVKESPIYVQYGGGYGLPYVGADGEYDTIVVTGSRIANRDDLGDLKLYTLPFRANVPAQSLKQVRFLRDSEIDGETLYRASLTADDSYVNDPELVFRFRNRKRDGLGEPLPQGQVALFQHTTAGRHLVGETHIKDKAVDEEVLITIPDDDIDVDLDIDTTDSAGDDWEEKELTVENYYEWPVTVEVELSDELDYDTEYRLSRFSGKVSRKDGKYLWRVIVPAEDEAKIRFRVTETEREVIDLED
jgi:hypothetical protein